MSELMRADASVVLLAAPAGAGKTVLLLQWTEQELRPHAWLQLEAAHNDPLVLLAGLAVVLGRVAVIDRRLVHWLRLAAPPLRERIIPSLCASLKESPPFILVLDDAHLLTNKACWEMLNRLALALPAGAQLVLGTRAEPPMPLARMEAAGRLLQIGGEALAFSTEETAELLRLRGLEADEETAAALQAATEGWAAGISLAALACDQPCTPDWVAGLDGGQRSIARYLTSEVLERQPRSVRTFLLETSILARLSGDSCRAVTGRSDSGHLLARLSRDNVFISPLDEKGEWFRYHHLFAELLHDELRRRDGARLPELHRRAAVWAAEQGDLEGAVRHWLAAGEVAKAADEVVRGHFLYSGQGKAETVRLWIESFTDEQIRSHVPLALVAGWVARATFDPHTLRKWMPAASSAPADDSPMPYAGGTQRAFQATLRAVWAADGVTAMREDAESAARTSADSHPSWRAVIDFALGIARGLSGDVSGAEKMLRQVAEDGRDHNVLTELAALGYLSILLCYRGRWEEAESEATRARQRFVEAELGMSIPLLVIPLAEARVRAHRGERVPGGDIEDIEMSLAGSRVPTWAALVHAVTLAQVALDQGDPTTAKRWSDHAASLLQTWPDAGILRSRVEHVRQLLQERGRTEPLTPAEQRVLDLLVTHFTLPDIAQRLAMSRNTLKTHLRDLYRKLDVHSRTEAVERARELGLLRS